MNNYQKCQLCNLPFFRLHEHHIIPKSEGGRNLRENKIRLCSNCHVEVHKGKKKIDDEIIERAIKANSPFERGLFNLSWTCDVCGKEINSLYPNQFRQHIVAHTLKCRGEL